MLDSGQDRSTCDQPWLLLPSTVVPSFGQLLRYSTPRPQNIAITSLGMQNAEAQCCAPLFGGHASYGIMSETRQSPRTPEFLHTVADDGYRVIVSLCPMRGGFIAASPSLRIILIAEVLHACSGKTD